MFWTIPPKLECMKNGFTSKVNARWAPVFVVLLCGAFCNLFMNVSVYDYPKHLHNWGKHWIINEIKQHQIVVGANNGTFRIVQYLCIVVLLEINVDVCLHISNQHYSRCSAYLSKKIHILRKKIHLAYQTSIFTNMYCHWRSLSCFWFFFCYEKPYEVACSVR